MRSAVSVSHGHAQWVEYMHDGRDMSPMKTLMSGDIRASSMYTARAGAEVCVCVCVSLPELQACCPQREVFVASSVGCDLCMYVAQMCREQWEYVLNMVSGRLW